MFFLLCFVFIKCLRFQKIEGSCFLAKGESEKPICSTDLGGGHNLQGLALQGCGFGLGVLAGSQG